jgi:GNAT superfamily N-acetyltransferase
VTTPAHVSICRASVPDIQVGLDRAAGFGWNSGLNDASILPTVDPEGFWIARVEGAAAAVAAGVQYGGSYAFYGLWIVFPEFRGLGIGRAIFDTALSRLSGRSVGIYAVPQQVAFFERHGFRGIFSVVRYEAADFTTASRGETTPISDQLMEAVCQYDATVFGFRRFHFIPNWIRQPGAIGLCCLVSGQIRGYGVLRRLRRGFRIAPLFADDNVVAQSLVSALLSAATEQPVFIEVPVANAEGIDLVSRMGMKPVYETFRMVSGVEPPVDIPRWFGVTNLNIG